MLRCALLHAGNTDLKDKKGNRKIELFELCISETSTHCGNTSVCNVSNNGTHNVYVSVNVVGLIDAIVAGAKEYIEIKEKILSSQTIDISSRAFGSIQIINK